MQSSLSQIVVHLDSSDHGKHRLAVARQLADQHGAALAALYAVTPGVIAAPYVTLGGETLGASLLVLDQERRDRARAAFDEVMKTPGAAATWNVLDTYSAIIEFSRQALYTDLMVLGQAEAGRSDAAGVPADFIESVLMTTGKPAVVVPWIGAQREVGGVVAIAWKETAQAARAVAAALPILQRARQVHVLSWAEAAPPAAAGMLDLDTWLRAHRVKPQWHHYGEESGQPGELILSATFDLSADLLVMGCYGHSRAREWVLGGVSRTVLRSMTLPVLMAH